MSRCHRLKKVRKRCPRQRDQHMEKRAWQCRDLQQFVITGTSSASLESGEEVWLQAQCHLRGESVEQGRFPQSVHKGSGGGVTRRWKMEVKRQVLGARGDLFGVRWGHASPVKNPPVDAKRQEIWDWSLCYCCSVAQLCPTLCDPMDCSMPGFSVLYHFLELAQTHVHWVGSVIPFSSCLLSFPASGSFPMSQLFASGDQSICSSASASVLPMNIQGWFPLELTGLISLLSKWLSRVFSNTTVQRHQFFGAQSFLLSSSHIHTWLLEKS